MFTEGQKALISVCAILPIFDIIVVALRFRARSITTMKYGTDDWAILTALILVVAQACMSIFAAAKGGQGAPGEELATHPKEFATFAKILFTGPIMYASGMLFIKSSTVLFYKRIFIRDSFRLVCNIVLTVIGGWFLASFFGQVFASNPVSMGWKNPTHNAINYNAFSVSMASINTLLDITIVTLPLFVIRTLHMSRNRKQLVCGIFGLGAFCVVASVVRLYYFAKLFEETNSNLVVVNDDYIWTVVELCISIIATCLPTLAPLFKDMRDIASIVASVRSAFSLQSMGSNGSNRAGQTSENTTGASQKSKDISKSWQKLDSVRGTSHDNIVNVGHDDTMELDAIESMPPGKIMVHRTFEAGSQQA